MKYVVMFTSRPDLDENVEPERAKAIYSRAYPWFQDNAQHLADNGAELHPVTTATTVKYGESGPVVVDGPFNEAKEIIGGFSILEAADLDGAIAVAKTWPLLELPGVALEIRPMVEDYSQFD